jgi:hypothetical protein
MADNVAVLAFGPRMGVHQPRDRRRRRPAQRQEAATAKNAVTLLQIAKLSEELRRTFSERQKALGERQPRLASNFEIFRRGLPAIRDFLVLDNLTFIQAAQTGLFDGRDVDEDVFPAALRLNEPIAFLRIEPLHRTACHRWPP